MRPTQVTDRLSNWVAAHGPNDRPTGVPNMMGRNFTNATAGIWYLLSCCCISPAYSSLMPPVLSVQIRICLSPAYKRNKKTIFLTRTFYTDPNATIALDSTVVAHSKILAHACQ